jgi:hypothetical protein
MGDSRPNSLVFCHAHSAQIPEFSRLANPGRLYRAIWGRDKKAGKDFHPLAIVHWPLKGAKFRPFQPCGNEAFLKKFPQVSTRLSKTNLERWFSCVNLPRRLSASALSNPWTSADNEGQSALPGLQKENRDR